MKRHEGNVHAFYSVKEDNLKGYTLWASNYMMS